MLLPDLHAMDLTLMSSCAGLVMGGKWQIEAAHKVANGESWNCAAVDACLDAAACACILVCAQQEGPG